MKILIADDEDYTREGLLEGIEWEEFGIDEIMQAVNGEEALKIARWFCPDIVLSDIRMPKLDGIAFAEEMLRLIPQSKLIFISGYMETEYLRSAIRLSVIDYIEKPIDIIQVKKALRRAVDEISRERKTKEENRDNREFRQQKLFELLVHKDSDMKTVEKLAEETGFPLSGEYVFIIAGLPRRSKAADKESGSIAGKAQETVTNMVNETGGKAIAVWQGDSCLEAIISCQAGNRYRLRPLYQRIMDNLPGCKLAVGIEAVDYKNIYNSCKTARAAMNYAFYQPDRRLFEIDEAIMHKKFMEPGIYGSFLRVLPEGPGKMSEWFQELFDDLYARKYYQKEQVYTLMLSLLTAIFRKYPESLGSLPGIDGEERLQSVLTGMDSLYEIQAFTETVLSRVQEREEELSGYGRVIRGALDYIAAHYGEEDLSIARIAEAFHFSPAYMNVLFKQEMKVTLKQYLGNYRLERAKKMLEQDYMKITEIAVKCGYANANYFAKVFRDAEGMTPVEYRNRKTDLNGSDASGKN